MENITNTRPDPQCYSFLADATRVFYITTISNKLMIMMHRCDSARCKRNSLVSPLLCMRHVRKVGIHLEILVGAGPQAASTISDHTSNMGRSFSNGCIGRHRQQRSHASVYMDCEKKHEAVTFRHEMRKSQNGNSHAICHSKRAATLQRSLAMRWRAAA